MGSVFSLVRAMFSEMLQLSTGRSVEQSFSLLHAVDRQERHHAVSGGKSIGWFEDLRPFLEATGEEAGAAEVDVISIESLPGVGKSTLLSHLKEKGHTVIMEPMEELFANYTPLVFGNLTRWFFTFQIEYMEWMAKVRGAVRAIKGASREKLIFVERSPLSQTHIFMKVFGPLISKWELDLLHRMWQRMWWQPTRYIFLTLDLHVAIQRLEARKREGEKIDRNYIKNLHDRYGIVFGAEADDRVLKVDLNVSDAEQDCVDKVTEALRGVNVTV